MGWACTQKAIFSIRHLVQYSNTVPVSFYHPSLHPSEDQQEVSQPLKIK